MKKHLTLAVVLCLLLAMLVGCSNTTNKTASNDELENGGVLVLKVNPELEVSYNQNGLVTNIEGINDDGKLISTMYQDYIGKDCTTVLSDLVTIIENQGFFATDDNPDKLITIEVSKGSYLPDEQFIANITDAVQTTVNNMQNKASKLPVQINNNGNRPELKPTAMSKDTALQIALNHAKLSINDVTNIEVELEDDDDNDHYDVEFQTKTLEYSYEIDAEYGTILKVRTEKADFVANISEDRALAIALGHAQVSSAQATNIDVDLDDDDRFYEVSFEVKDTEYIYIIDAENGSISSFVKNVDNEDDKLEDHDDDLDDDHDDDHDDDNDDDYDDDNDDHHDDDDND